MSLEQIKPKEIMDEWIPATERRVFRRLYFTTERLYVIKAPNDRIKFYLAVEIVVMFLLLSAFFNQSVRISGIMFGVILSFLCGTIIGGLFLVVLITIMVWSMDNKIKNLSPKEILKLKRENYFINYADISKIEFNILPKDFFRKNGELIVVTTKGTHRFIVQDLNFEEVKGKIKKIKGYMNQTQENPEGNDGNGQK
jgi:hypothetical protein